MLVNLTVCQDMTSDTVGPDTTINATAERTHSENVKGIRQGRKRVRNEKEWKRNIVKRLRNEGKSYKNKLGQSKRQRELKSGCGCNCRFKCHENFNMANGEDIFHSYWNLGCLLSRQRNFILKFSNKVQKARGIEKLESRRTYSYKFFLPNIGLSTTKGFAKCFSKTPLPFQT